MAEAVGLTSALLSLTIFTYHTSKSLYEAVSSFKSQRKTIRDLQADLSSLVSVLESIHKQAQHSQEVERLEPLRQPLECCSTTCRELREMLDVCTEHSREGRDSVRDWLSMRYHEKSFEDMKRRLASYKSTLSITFESIYIRDHSITQGSLNDLKNSIRGTKEDLEDQLHQVQQIISGADASFREILQTDQARLRSSLDSLARAQRVADITHPKVVVEDNRAGPGSRAIFGTDTSQPQFNLNVSNNVAGIGAVVSAGVHSPQTLQALLGDSRTPEFALAVQALQTQPRSTNSMDLQSLRHHLSTGRRQGLVDTPAGLTYPTSSRISNQSNAAGMTQPLARAVGSVADDNVNSTNSADSA